MAVLLLVTGTSPCDPCQTTQCVVPRTAMLAYRGNLNGQWIGLGACVPQSSMDVIILCGLNSCLSTTIALPMVLVAVSLFDQTRMTDVNTHCVGLLPRDRNCPIAPNDSPTNAVLETSDHNRLPVWTTFLEALAVTDLPPTQENLQRVLIWITAGYSLPMISHQALELVTEVVVVAMPQPHSLLQARVMATNLHQTAKLNLVPNDRVDGELPSKLPLLLQHHQGSTQIDSSTSFKILHRSRLPMLPPRLLLPLVPVVETMPNQALVDPATTVVGVTSVSLASTTCFSKPTALPNALLQPQPPRHLVERVQTDNRTLATLLLGFLTALVAKLHLKRTAIPLAAALVAGLVI